MASIDDKQAWYIVRKILCNTLGCIVIGEVFLLPALRHETEGLIVPIYFVSILVLNTVSVSWVIDNEVIPNQAWWSHFSHFFYNIFSVRKKICRTIVEESYYLCNTSEFGLFDYPFSINCAFKWVFCPLVIEAYQENFGLSFEIVL